MRTINILSAQGFDQEFMINSGACSPESVTSAAHSLSWIQFSQDSQHHSLLC